MKVLFLIHDLGPGGAEKVLVNLVNYMDPARFEITVMTLFDVGVNRGFLAPHVRYQSVFKRDFPGNSHVMKLFSPSVLYRYMIREPYELVISYLEGPSARVISGCPNGESKKVAWVHIQMHNAAEAAVGFRSLAEAREAYGRMDAMVFVSEEVRESFCRYIHPDCPLYVLHNTNLSDEIRRKAAEPVDGDAFPKGLIHWCGIGKLIPRKGFDRLLRVHARLLDAGYPMVFHILGSGPKEGALRAQCEDLGIGERVRFWGYQTNPYAYLARCDFFSCASYGEGFSTAATESLIVGTPVITMDIGGMKELLGTHGEWGVVTENNEDALFAGIRAVLDAPDGLAVYRQRAETRGRDFDTSRTVRATEETLGRVVKNE